MRITAEREMVMVDQQKQLEDAEQKVLYLVTVYGVIWGKQGEALKESVHITAEREMVMVDQQRQLEDAEQKVLLVT